MEENRNASKIHYEHAIYFLLIQTIMWSKPNNICFFLFSYFNIPQLHGVEIPVLMGHSKDHICRSRVNLL